MLLLLEWQGVTCFLDSLQQHLVVSFFKKKKKVFAGRAANPVGLGCGAVCVLTEEEVSRHVN